MERFVKLTAPIGKADFVLKLMGFLLVGGLLNHMRDFVSFLPPDRNTFLRNFIDAAWTAVPMCTFALILIGHLNKLQKQLYRQATTDPLTQLRNRRWFDEWAEDQTQGKHALIMLDVDHFKQVNDRFGHCAGDLCLKAVAKHLSSSIRADDVCARIGGEEFVVVLMNADHEALEKTTARLCCGITCEPVPDTRLQVTLSAGVTWIDQYESVSSALRNADAALYAAKEAGRAQFKVTKSMLAPISQDDVTGHPIIA